MTTPSLTARRTFQQELQSASHHTTHHITLTRTLIPRRLMVVALLMVITKTQLKSTLMYLSNT